MPSLEGSVALVTGASRGVGKGVVLGLAEAGATIFLTGRTLTGDGSLESTAAEAEILGGKCVCVACDHTNDAETEAALARVVNEAGRLDLLVNSAWGGYENMSEDGEFTYAKPFWQQKMWRWDAMFNAGVRAAFACARLAARQMVEQGSGLIVNVSSLAGQFYQGNTIYGVSKSATDRMVGDMAVELAPHGVSTVSIYPGLVRTENVLAAEFFDLSNSESPQFIGRAIAHLLSDPDIAAKSGSVVVAADLAAEYGFTDIDGKRPKPLRSKI